MRKQAILTLVIFLITHSLFSQKFIDNYYNYNWQGTVGRDDASFFSRALNTDSGWYRNDYYIISTKNSIQMVGLYSDKETKIKNGTFRWFFPTGILKQMGKYKENKKEGTWLEWHSNGVLKDSSNYLNDHHHGISLSWYRNGYPKDSSNIDNNGNGIFAAWFDNGNPSEAGRYQNFKKAGKWVYYHANGNISSVETFNGDSLINFQYYDENGKPKSGS